MQRRNFIRNNGLLLTAFLLKQKSFANFFYEEPWKIKMLTGNIGIFTEKGGTILFMLSKEGIVVVDAQFPDSAQHLIDELKKKNEKPFNLLINTHHHADHTSGNIAFKDIASHILAHENSKTNQQKAAKEKNNESNQLYPDQTYADEICKTIGDEKIYLHYFGAGHTNGDSIIHFQHANIIHIGDLIFNRKHPYIDKAAGANISSWIKVLDKTLNTFDQKAQFVCGHSGEGYDTILKMDDIKAFNNYLQKLLQFTEAEIQSGKSKEEILKNTFIPGAEEWKGEGAVRALTAAYSEIVDKQ